MHFPKKRLSYDEVHGKLSKFKKESRLDEAGVKKQIIMIYHLTGLRDLQRVARDALFQFMESNAAFPQEKGVHEMEREVVSMIGSLWGHPNACGTMTSGGTESNLLAMYTALNRSKGKRGTVILPASAHPSFWKACYMFGLKPISIPLKGDFTADAERMGKAVTKDTIAIVGSYGSYPWATIDPIEELGEIAERHSLYFHVDGAWGGLICPWLARAGYDVPEIGFKIKAICSMNGDPHKQGFSVYPAGSIIFREEELLKHAGFTYIDSGWAYSSPGLLGSRPGSSIAVTWALFNYLGEEGYISLSKQCMESTTSFIMAAKKINGIECPTEPKMNLAMLVSTTINMDAVKKYLNGMGWVFFNRRGKPFSRENGIALGISPYHKRVLPLFLKDLRKAVSEVGI